MRRITFGSSYAKLSNAGMIINGLQQVLTLPNSFLIKTSWEPAQGLPCGISLAHKNEPGAMELLVQPSGKMPVSYGLSGLIGDCVHNLRTSLDAAIESVRRAKGAGKPEGKFPFAEEENGITAEKIKTLSKSVPDVNWVEYFKEEVRPTRTSNALIWTLNK